MNKVPSVKIASKMCKKEQTQNNALGLLFARMDVGHLPNWPHHGFNAIGGGGSYPFTCHPTLRQP